MQIICYTEDLDLYNYISYAFSWWIHQLQRVSADWLSRTTDFFWFCPCFCSLFISTEYSCFGPFDLQSVNYFYRFNLEIHPICLHLEPKPDLYHLLMWYKCIFMWYTCIFLKKGPESRISFCETQRLMPNKPQWQGTEGTFNRTKPWLGPGSYRGHHPAESWPGKRGRGREIGQKRWAEWGRQHSTLHMQIICCTEDTELKEAGGRGARKGEERKTTMDKWRETNK